MLKGIVEILRARRKDRERKALALMERMELDRVRFLEGQRAKVTLKPKGREIEASFTKDRDLGDENDFKPS